MDFYQRNSSKFYAVGQANCFYCLAWGIMLNQSGLIAGNLGVVA